MASSSQLLHQIEQFVNNIDEHTPTASQLSQFIQKRHLSVASSVSIAEYHVLAYIGDHPATNAVSISKSLGITQGGISKIAARLSKKGLIHAQYARDNKREVSYTLTSLGEELHELHTTLHKQTESRLNDLISRYTEEEIECITGFLAELSNIF